MNEESKEYKGFCYFVTDEKIAVRDEDLDVLWKQNKIAVHCPGSYSGPDSKSLNPPDYEDMRQRIAIKELRYYLSGNGGFVWAESRLHPNAKVGRVRRGSEIEIVDATWTDSPKPKYKEKAGSEAKLKTLQLEDVKEVAPHEAKTLWAARPIVKGTWPIGKDIWRWEGCGSRLAALVEGRNVKHTWKNLRPELRLSVCAEFLRYHEDSRYPELRFLLLPVADRDPGKKTSGHHYDVDIYGLEEDGAEVLAQVPLRDDNFKYHMQMTRKVEALKEYGSPNRKLV